MNWIDSGNGSAQTIRYYLMHIPRVLFLNERDVSETKQKTSRQSNKETNKPEETNKTAKMNRALKERNETLSG